MNEIIYNALENLYNTMEVKAYWEPGGPLDGTVKLNFNGRRYKFIAEVKKEVRPHQIPYLENHFTKYPNLIVIAENIFPRVKEKLKAAGIAYLEANGNLFIKTKEVFCFVDTNKKQATNREKANRAFTKTGLKVVFHFLLDKDLINKTQREIAELAGVGLGNIPQVIDGLKETGYIIPLNKKKYVWENRQGLLERWINEYATELRPKLRKGKYTVRGEWRAITLNRETTVWGGEPAAEILTNHLRPEKLTLYTKESKAELIRNYHLELDANGEIEVLEMFWDNTANNRTAPALLIYADLILTGGKRNLETANLIFNEYIKPNL